MIDIKDTHPNLGIFDKQCEKRIKYYKKCNHVIHYHKMDGTKEKIEKRAKNKNKKEPYEIKECLIPD